MVKEGRVGWHGCSKGVSHNTTLGDDHIRAGGQRIGVNNVRANVDAGVEEAFFVSDVGYV